MHPLQGVTMTLPNGTGAPDVEVDGIDQSTTSAFVRLALGLWRAAAHAPV